MKPIIVQKKYTGTRLDVFLAEKTKQSRSQIQKSIRANTVHINGVPAKKVGETLSRGDAIVIEEKKISIPKRKKKVEVPLNIPVIYETDDYAVINKPAGVLMHPTEAGEQQTLAAWLQKQYPQIRTVGDRPDIRPGIVHRLDKDVSGVLVVAKTQNMFDHLKKQFKERTVEKEYTALVYGAPERDHGEIHFPIDRGKDGRMAARPKVDTITLETIRHIQPGKPAFTEFRVTKRFTRYSLLNVRIHTGRTHQIRVHLFASDHPIVGDKLYINKKLIKKGDTPLQRLFLHANRLCFHDLSNDTVCFETPLPNELQHFLVDLI